MLQQQPEVKAEFTKVSSAGNESHLCGRFGQVEVK